MPWVISAYPPPSDLQWPHIQPIYATPSPDKLKIAIEALEFYAAAWNSEPNGDPRIPGDASGWTTEPADDLVADEGKRARAALSALKGEGASRLQQPPEER
jgi:hypothetical protein